MSKITPWRRLEELADVLSHKEQMLRHVLERWRAEVDASHGFWDSATGDAFRDHAGRGHRQRHLEQAADRLHVAAVTARAAAQQNYLEQHGTPIGGGAGPGGGAT
ncbi:MAG: hypothetical protein ACRDT1_15195 [Micromonosporaceae bacterium]